MLMIRTMKRAAYQDCCAPHFGLAVTRTRTYKPYQALSRSHGPSHGESRAFREGPKKPRPSSAMAAIADRASVAERAAEVTARESQELKLYELLETRIGEEAQGLISRRHELRGSSFAWTTLPKASCRLRGRDEYYVLNAARRSNGF